MRLRAYNVWQIRKFLSCEHHPDILLFGFGEWRFKTRTRTCWGILVFEDYLPIQCIRNLCILTINILHTSGATSIPWRVLSAPTRPSLANQRVQIRSKCSEIHPCFNFNNNEDRNQNIIWLV